MQVAAECHKLRAVLDDYVSLIPAKLPVNRVPDPPEQVRKPLCVVFLRGMVTAFCDTESDVDFYVRVARKGGFGSVVFEWSDAGEEYVQRKTPPS